MKKLLKSNELVLVGIILILWVAFGLVNPNILSISNVFSITRASIVTATFALAAMLVMIVGGVDISFLAIGSFAMYVVVKYFVEMQLMGASMAVIFLAAIAVGIVLHLINWFFIDRLSLPIFIVTVGTQSLYKGYLLAFVGTSYITRLPDSLRALATRYVASVTDQNGITYNLHILVLVVAVMYVLVHLLLTYTTLGRHAYAIGADATAAKRAGINISKTRFLIFVIAGAIAGIAGMFHGTLNRTAVPADIVGGELAVIAAVFLGGGASKRARGSVLGTALGVFLLALISNNLILLGIPSYWQQAVTGTIIIIGIVLQSLRGATQLGKKGASS